MKGKSVTPRLVYSMCAMCVASLLVYTTRVYTGSDSGVLRQEDSKTMKVRGIRSMADHQDMFAERWRYLNEGILMP